MLEKNKIITLIAEVQKELEKLEQLIEKLSLHQQVDPENEILIESTALKIHNFYTGCERIFKLIGYDLNGSIPDSSDWHRRLLSQMSIKVEGVRPSVISEDTQQKLVELLAFRHVVRSVYGYELDAIRIQLLVKFVLTVYPSFKNEIEDFCRFLDELTKKL